jgi:3-oxoacyl-[acyl-carrier protein] reductase
MFTGKTILITGASRGIGKGIASKFAEYRAYIGINFVSNEKAAEETLQQVKKKGGNGILLKADISQQSDVDAMLETLLDARRFIDILVNNAGVYERKNIDKLTPSQWGHTLSVNLTGSFLVSKQVIPYLKPRGRIIFISSQLAFRGSFHGADYGASKAGILGLMKSLALELAPKQITVNAIAPGLIDTDILSDYTPEMKRERAKEIPLRRLGTPEDIAYTCVFLASDQASYITGETININGGLYIH